MLTYARQIGIIDPEISDHDTSLSRIMLLTQFNGNNTRNLGQPGDAGCKENDNGNESRNTGDAGFSGHSSG